MSGDTHSAVAAATALTCAATVGSSAMIGSNESVLAGVCVAVLAGLFPDLDYRQSKGAKLLDKVILIVIPALFIEMLITNKSKAVIGSVQSVQQIVALAALLVLAFIARTRPHREITHSIVAALTTTLLVYTAFFNNFWVWWLIGYASHLFVDYFNTKGEALLWPINKRYCLKMCSANGTVNNVLKYTSAVVAVAIYVFIGRRNGIF